MLQYRTGKGARYPRFNGNFMSVATLGSGEFNGAGDCQRHCLK